MKASEIIFETTEEDRALISLGRELHKYITQHKNDFETETDNPEVVGSIGQLFDTPFDGKIKKDINSILIQVQSDYGIRERRKTETGARVTKSPNQENIMGLWYYDRKLIVLNFDYIGTKSLTSTIIHELRHALDTFKSEGRSDIVGTRYNKPISPSGDEYQNYRSQPTEINARFSQVLGDMVRNIPLVLEQSPNNYRVLIEKMFFSTLDRYHIADLFPEKEKSSAYKRLIKRGMDFIQKETDYVLKTLKKN